MDRAEEIIASKRLAKWPREWKSMIVELPVTESKVIVELVALLDARPDETGSTRG